MFLKDFKQNSRRALKKTTLNPPGREPPLKPEGELVFQIVVPKGLELGAAGKAHQHMWEPSAER